MGEYVRKHNVDPGEIRGYTVEAPTLSSWLKREDKPILLDIRNKEDFEKAYIKDSVHSEWDDVEKKIRLGVFPRNKKDCCNMLCWHFISRNRNRFTHGRL